MKKIVFIALLLIAKICDGQGTKTNIKCECTNATKLIIDTLQFLTNTNESNFIEFIAYGGDGMQSAKFTQYMKLYDTASEPELLCIIETSVNPSVIGYAYMAYAFRCNEEKRKEKPLIRTNNNFFVLFQNGFEVGEMPFLKFKAFCKIDGKYNPRPKQ